MDFLTQVARGSGKLLKGGEPDLGTVAKMVLNDWLRGRIPYYVLPPDVEGEVEVEKTGEKDEPAVQQIFSKIFVSQKFLPDDVKEVEGEGKKEGVAAAGAEKDANGDTQGDGEEKADTAEGETENVTDWDEVFESVVGKEVPADIQPDEDEEDEDEEDDGDEELVDEEAEEATSDAEVSRNPSSTPAPTKPNKTSRLAKISKTKGLPTFTIKPIDETPSSPQKRPASDSEPESSSEETNRKSKTPRMKTNKRKIGEHYYETANVKNKNRKKGQKKREELVRPDAVEKRLKGKGTRRIGK